MIGPPAAERVELVSENAQETATMTFQIERKITHVRQLYSKEKLVIHKSVQSPSERVILDVKFNAKKLGKKQTFKKQPILE